MPTDQPCDICGAITDKNTIDTWFCYVTCPEHAWVPPAYKDEAKYQLETYGWINLFYN